MCTELECIIVVERSSKTTDYTARGRGLMKEPQGDKKEHGAYHFSRLMLPLHLHTLILIFGLDTLK